MHSHPSENYIVWISSDHFSTSRVTKLQIEIDSNQINHEPTRPIKSLVQARPIENAEVHAPLSSFRRREMQIWKGVWHFHLSLSHTRAQSDSQYKLPTTANIRARKLSYLPKDLTPLMVFSRLRAIFLVKEFSDKVIWLAELPSVSIDMEI